MTNDVEHLHVLICHIMSSLVKRLFTSFAHFNIGLPFNLLSFDSSFLCTISSNTEKGFILKQSYWAPQWLSR